MSVSITDNKPKPLDTTVQVLEILTMDLLV